MSRDDNGMSRDELVAFLAGATISSVIISTWVIFIVWLITGCE